MPTILPLRDMQLDGQHVEAGKPVAVSKDAAQLALRMGWAEEVDAKAKLATKPAKPTDKD